MPSLKDIRKRIGTVRSTQQITKAMKMIAAVKLRRSQDKLLSARPYSHKLQEVVSSLVMRLENRTHPLLVEHEQIQKVLVILMTSDRGLCGSFNANLTRFTEGWIKGNQSKYEKIDLSCIGRKGHDYFKRRNYSIRDYYRGILEKPNYETIADIAQGLAEKYQAAEYDSIMLIYNEFRSAIQQKVTVRPLLPIPVERFQATSVVDYLYEPNQIAIVEALLPLYVKICFFQALLESAASEHGARMTAMDGATKNALEMRAALTLQYNRLRQAAITKELMEIVGGAEALKK